MSDRQSSPHERMLAYLRAGDRLVPGRTRTAQDWDSLYRVIAEAADPPCAEPPETPDLSSEAWYQNALDTGLDRSVVRWGK